MGGRSTARIAPDEERLSDRDAWIREVSTARLERYRDLLVSGGQFERLDGSPRSAAQRTAFRSLVDAELSRRGRS